MAKKKQTVEVIDIINENIITSPLEEIMGDRYATYAKYVIQDRAIPDVRDGLKPVQRRIIYSMYENGNTINKPTKKCAHTVGAVMGTYHPHGDTSIYEALARMSQDWKVRYPLIDFQGNNGSIDGDSPAAYRYTESRLSKLSNELVRDLEKNTVDLQNNFDDTKTEPTVLPSRFPNLLCNGSEGIAVALATEIPPHNLKEVVEAVIYRIQHKNATIEDLRQFVLGPDFPTGGIIYKSEGLDNIYLTGKGKIEVAARCEIAQNKDIQQIIITEIPYKVVKQSLVHEMDKIRASKSIDGILEVRDESDWKGIRIVVDVKKGAKADLILAYLKKKTLLHTTYSANMVAIVDGRPKTLNLLDFVDAYIDHQVHVTTRQSKFDLNKCQSRLHIVEGLILAALNINEVVSIIKQSKDKSDSKINLIKRFNLSNDQAEAIVMMPLYKLSHTDELVLQQEKKQLVSDIEKLTGILEDPNKLNRVIVKDLKYIIETYADERRTTVEDKLEVKEINKRDLIAKEETVLAITKDGYVKRSTIKSYKGTGENSLPGIKEGDIAVGIGNAMTTDYLICFTNIGNYICLPVHIIPENRWRDEGVHLNTFVTIGSGEKIVKTIVVNEFRSDVYLAFISKFGQIKRMSLGQIDSSRHNRPVRCMRLLNSDEIAGIELLTGNSNILVLTSGGNCSLFNENEINPLGLKAGGIKSISGLGKQTISGLLTFDENEKRKILLVTDKGCIRVYSNEKVNLTARLAKPTIMYQCFKNDIHTLVGAIKVNPKFEEMNISTILSNGETFDIKVNDFYITDVQNAKKNTNIPSKETIVSIIGTEIERVDEKTITHPIKEKEAPVKEEIVQEELIPEEKVEIVSEAKEEIQIQEEVSNIEQIEEDKVTENTSNKKDEKKKSYEQISIFDEFEE
jgi:topoisomerase-4 subunit A